jgi:non-specific serine/threonine protein kinase
LTGSDGPFPVQAHPACGLVREPALLKLPQWLAQPRHRRCRLVDAMGVKAARARPSNLPTELTTFVGRRQELREVKRLLTTTRLLTLTGRT